MAIVTPTGPDAPFVGQLPGETAHAAIERLEHLPGPLYNRVVGTDAYQALATAAAAESRRAIRAAMERSYPKPSHITEAELFAGYRGLREGRG